MNLAWVFFRANEMKDAIKVIKGMINVKNIVLPGALQQRLSFLNFINFGPWLQNVTSDSYIVIWILLTFIIVLKFKNSTENYLERRISTSVSLASGVLLAVAVGNMIQLSEFLYFNF